MPGILPPPIQFIGDKGKRYKFVACVLRNNGSGWEQINVDNHKSIGITSISNDTNVVKVTYDFTAKEVCAFVACTDEEMTRDSYLVGTSVGLSYSDIYIYRHRSVGGYIYYDGTNWVKTYAEGVTGATFSNGILTVTHEPVSGLKGNVTCRGGSDVPNLGGLGVTTTDIVIRDYAGNLITTPNTNMKYYFERVSSNAKVDPNDYVSGGGNIWCYGIFEV